MKYYKLTTNSDAKVIGVRNGIHQGEIKWKKFSDKKTKENIEKYFSLAKYWQNINKTEECNFEIEYVEAYKSAKMTDFFSFTPRLWGVDFFVSEKAKIILEKFNLPANLFIPVNIYQREILYKYWTFYIPYSYREDSFDFLKSVFYEETGFEQTKEVDVADMEAFLQNKSVRPSKLAFNKLFNPKLDLFSTLFSGYGYYISEAVKDAIEENKLTGFKIKEPVNPEIIF